MLESRPPWQPPDKNPKDMEAAEKALRGDFNPNDPQVDPSLLLYHNKFGIVKDVARSQPEFGQAAQSRKMTHRSLSVSWTLFWIDNLPP